MILAMLALTKWFVCYSHERMPKNPALTFHQAPRSAIAVDRAFFE